MSKSLFLALGILAALTLAGCGGNNDTELETTATWTGGEDLTVAKSTALAKLTSQPADFVGETVLLKGEVTGVCKGSGCWVELTDEDGNSFIAKSVDHSINFPRDCEGQTAVVQGLIVSQPAQEHTEPEHAEHAHDEDGEEPHVCPAPTYMLNMKAAKLI